MASAPLEHAFARHEILPSWFVNGLQARFGALSNLRLTFTDGAVQVPVGDGADAQVALNIAGRWRWVLAPISAAHPGGVTPGLFTVWAVATDTVIVDSPDPYTDETDYGFALRVRAGTEPPPLEPGAVEIVTRVGSGQWDGQRIVSLLQEVGPLAASDPRVPSANEKAALAGTFGVPRDANRFVTAGDKRVAPDRHLEAPPLATSNALTYNNQGGWLFAGGGLRIDEVFSGAPVVLEVSGGLGHGGINDGPVRNGVAIRMDNGQLDRCYRETLPVRPNLAAPFHLTREITPPPGRHIFEVWTQNFGGGQSPTFVADAVMRVVERSSLAPV